MPQGAPHHTYPSNHGPGTSWAMTEAWTILDALPVGLLDYHLRAYLAGAIAATLMRHLREKAPPPEDTRALQ